jgi:hypothetical protein
MPNGILSPSPGCYPGWMSSCMFPEYVGLGVSHCCCPCCGGDTGSSCSPDDECSGGGPMTTTPDPRNPPCG